MSEQARTRRGRRPTLSLQLVLATAIEMLDADGEQALTLRALAGRLDTGVGSLYHYVAGKDELLDRATNEVLGEVMVDLALPDDPYEALRALCYALYACMQRHQWVASYLMRDTGMQPNSMRLFDLFGRQTQRLELTSRQRFIAVSTLVSFVVGVGAEMRELPEAMVAAGKSQAESLHEYADSWRALDPAEFPFVHETVEVFETHDDAAQFEEGVDIFLAGLASQAGDITARKRR